MKRTLPALSIAILGLSALSAHGQSASPLRQTVASFSDRAYVQVELGNTYDAAQYSEIEVYDESWKPVKVDYISHRSAQLGPRGKLTVTALIPFDGKNERVVHICNSILPRLRGKGLTYRGEACSKVIAKRLQIH